MVPNDVIIERNDSAKPYFSLLDDMWIERGTKEDWDQLHQLHYKAEGMPPGARYWRVVTGNGYLVGIVMTSSVALLSAPRHKIFPKLKPGNDTPLTNRYRATWLNKNMRRAARIVTDTMYRGVGVSYRMVNLACRMEGFRFVEIQSSMSKFNPFDKKAGFRHAHLNSAAAYEAGIKFMRRYFAAHPADHNGVLTELRAMPDAMRERILIEMKDFYYRHSAKEKTGSNLNAGTRKVMEKSDTDIIKEIQQLVFATPVYGIYENPDLGRDLPERLPIKAFDLQLPNEPLRLDLL